MPSSSTREGGPVGLPDLRVRLTWLNVFRLGATTLLLVALALRAWSRASAEPTLEESASFGLAGLAYVACLVHGLLLRYRPASRSLARAQVAGDLVVATALVGSTGVLESPFTFTYLLAVLSASIVLTQRGTLWTAAAGSLSLGALMVGGGSAALLGWGRALYLLGSSSLAQLLIAVLASYLARELSTAGGRLSEREADLRSLGALQEQILASMPSGLVTCDASGRVTFLNRAALSILGLPAAVTGGEVEALLPGVLSLPVNVRREVEAPTPHGLRVLGLTVTRLPAEGAGLLVVFQDLTELRQMAEALRRADQLAALGTLAAQLAHEVRNPLAAMRGSAQMLAEGNALAADPYHARLTTILLREADRLSVLVEDFLRFARPQAPRRAPVRLDTLIAETLEMLRQDPLAQALEVEAHLVRVEAQVDPDQVRQVVLNLVRNACEAAGPGGKVRVTLERRPGGPHIRVWDSGGGLSPADRGRIFEPFFTTRAGGTGLGLPTAQAIVHAHGGHITVTSSREAGTEFTVGLPPDAPDEAPGEAVSAHPGRG